MDTMKAARLHGIGESLTIDSVPVPHPAEDEVLVRVGAAGICHSDVNYSKGIAPVARLPITLGHEIAGTVAERGPGVLGVDVGDRVCVHYVVGCGSCSYCTSGWETYCDKYRMIGKDVEGGFAQFVRVPARNVLRIPDSIPFAEAAILGCAVSTALHALRRGRAKEGETVIVNGVGGLGLHAVQLASRVFNARRVIAVDISEAKLKIAEGFGAGSLVMAGPAAQREIRELTGERPPDLALDFVGTRSTVESLLQWVGKGGRVAVVGISQESLMLSPYKSLIGKEAELMGVNDHLKSELAELVDMVGSGTLDLSHSITNRVGLDDVNRGMEILAKQTGPPIRVVVEA